jgi:uncharacterized protein
MVNPLMPKATAIWLIDNTSLSFEQIADFCGLHLLEVQGIADGDVAKNMLGVDPIGNGQVSKEEVERCEKNPSARLTLSEDVKKYIIVAKKGRKTGKYTPIAMRQDKPDAVAWLLKHCPEMNEAQIAKLIGTTKSTISAVKDKNHWNTQNIRARDPVLLGICTQSELERVYDLAKKKFEGLEAKKKKDLKKILDKKAEVE